MKIVDINCDTGESYGHFKMGNDSDIFPFISSCNIACGFHGGDPYHIQKTIDLALKHGVQIGAHPSYPDRYGFGRRDMNIPEEELESILKYQISALKGMTEASGGKLHYVKPHGALYNTAAIDESLAHCIIKSIRAIDDQLALMGLAGSVMETVAHKYSISFIPEAFADRRYSSMGQLASRSNPEAVIMLPEQAAKQVLNIAKEGMVEAIDGTLVKVSAKSFCVHGDNPKAVSIVKEIRRVVTDAGFEIKAFDC